MLFSLLDILIKCTFYRRLTESNNMHAATITAHNMPYRTCVPRPLWTISRCRLYLVNVLMYTANPCVRVNIARIQKTNPNGGATRNSSSVGLDFRWNETRTAHETMQRYIDRRIHESSVLSLAQWSRASEVSLGRINGANNGVEQKTECSFASSLFPELRACGLALSSSHC